MRTIALLGATGSIGTQTLDIVRCYPERFKIAALTAHSNSEKLFSLVREFRPAVAALTVEPEFIPDDLRFCEWFFGEDAVLKATEAAKADDVLSAVVGIAGLPAALKALEVSERLLLANKESLVTGGSLVTEKVKALNRQLIPVDSEHSAIFQCLQARQGNPVRELIVTASGGPFRRLSKEEVYNATKEMALGHPTWKMGAKITVDCATMMNKGLELIEAHHLFGMPMSQIRALVHPQSIIHSMVEFEDGAVLAQLGVPDMRVPIGYALGYPQRLPFGGERLSLAKLGSLTFEEPDTERFPCLKLAVDAQNEGGTMPVVLNGANEVAVAAFLKGEIPFEKIADTVAYTLDKTEKKPVSCPEDVYEADREARGIAKFAVSK